MVGMPRRIRQGRQWSGLYYPRQARGMSRSELVPLAGISKQQLSRLENGQIRLRLDHLKPFAAHLGYTPEQMLLWGRFPGNAAHDSAPNDPRRKERGSRPLREVPELDSRGSTGGTAKRNVRKDG